MKRKLLLMYKSQLKTQRKNINKNRTQKAQIKIKE
jgi:hypothetical protein